MCIHIKISNKMIGTNKYYLIPLSVTFWRPSDLTIFSFHLFHSIQIIVQRAACLWQTIILFTIVTHEPILVHSSSMVHPLLFKTGDRSVCWGPLLWYWSSLNRSLFSKLSFGLRSICVKKLSWCFSTILLMRPGN